MRRRSAAHDASRPVDRATWKDAENGACALAYPSNEHSAFGVSDRAGAGQVQDPDEPQDDVVVAEEGDMHGGMVSNVPQRRRRHHQHSFYRRLLALVKSTWTGVKTALGIEQTVLGL